ncbi:MAG: MOSC domain-containing protein [Halioglobus sp.]
MEEFEGAKKIPSLMTLTASFLEAPSSEGSSPAIITAPDGESCETRSSEINSWLSDKLKHPVTLWPLLPADALDHYRRGAPDSEDFEQELREIFARTPDEPLPDLEVFAEVMEYESPPGTYFDAFPLLIMSEQSLASMAAFRPESEFDVSRFRPNILLNCEGVESPYPEQLWVGKTVSLGETSLEIVADCPRCSMTTHGFADLPKDPGIMRALVQANGGNLGVYAKVVEGGTIDLGSSLEL